MDDKRIEEMTLNAWPAFQTIVRNGWLLRLASGFTKRSNSVSALYSESSVDLHEQIQYCERVYAREGLDVVFKITPFNPPELDSILDEQGYSVLDPTSLKVLDSLDHAPAPTYLDVTVYEQLSSEWLDDLTGITGLSARNREIKQQLFSRSSIPYGFFTLYDQGRPAACGIGALEENVVGIFDIATAPAYRKRGYGTQILLHILQWARVKGATSSYLQVVQTNLPANRLYDRLHYRDLYAYWYRTKHVE